MKLIYTWGLNLINSSRGYILPVISEDGVPGVVVETSIKFKYQLRLNWHFILFEIYMKLIYTWDLNLL